jgi:tRNA threonylcarbamoyladenosine biosynthesis protein TsaE
MPKKLVLASNNLSETKKIGKALGRLLKSGDVVLLNGELGAGKTTLVKAVSTGLGIKSDHYVVSPSYAIINEYNANLKIYHFDFYRINNIDEFYELGPYEYLSGEGVCLIEWGDKFKDAMPKERLEILLEQTGTFKRRMTVTAFGRRYKEIAAGLREYE